MKSVQVVIERFVDSSQLGFVECKLIDAWGKMHLFADKGSIFSALELHEDSTFPLPGNIACEILKEWKDAKGRAIVSITTEQPWAVDSKEGIYEFDVLPDQLDYYKPYSNMPKTLAELANWMKEQCYNFTSYAINGNIIDEGYGVEKSGREYVWFYTERGQKDVLKSFLTEEEVTNYACEQITKDKWAQSHCIGFTTKKSKSLELAAALQKLGIEFFQDEIPYFGPQAPVYRTFVLGCNVKRVIDLKERYYDKL